jgi:hypothetical protein
MDCLAIVKNFTEQVSSKIVSVAAERPAGRISGNGGGPGVAAGGPGAAASVRAIAASGILTFAGGHGVNASGIPTVAGRHGAIASGILAVASGRGATASGILAVAGGIATVAAKNGSKINKNGEKTLPAPENGQKATVRPGADGAAGGRRWRATTVQDAGALTDDHRMREASGSAPALWRFDRARPENSLTGAG